MILEQKDKKCMHKKRKPFIIAGPCAIEEVSVMKEVAEELCRLQKKYGIEIIFKSSFDKANRTSIKSYRGPGLDKGLDVLAEIKSQYGLRVLTDIHESWQANPVAQVVDILQIPAFLSRQTDLLVAAGATGKIVNIKKGQFLSAKDLGYSVEKVKSTGCPEIWATERGSMFGYNDLIVDFRNIDRMKDYADKVIMDCTHSVQIPNGSNGVSGGNPQYISAMSVAAKAFGADGYFFETHPDPMNALSDSSSMLQLNKLESVIVKLL